MIPANVTSIKYLHPKSTITRIIIIIVIAKLIIFSFIYLGSAVIAKTITNKATVSITPKTII